MNNKAEVLEKFDSVKLIDIAKNYRQYGYEEEIHLSATKILESRGITEVDLRLAGHEKNSRYETAKEILRAYKKSARLALIFYFAAIILKVLSAYADARFQVPGLAVLIFNLAILIAFFTALFRSFIDQKDFYRSIGKELDLGDQSVFFIFGLPFYFYFYFHYRNRMKEDINLIE